MAGKSAHCIVIDAIKVFYDRIRSRTMAGFYFKMPDIKPSRRSKRTISRQEPGEDTTKKQCTRKSTAAQPTLLEALGIRNMSPETYLPSDLDKPELVTVRTLPVLKKFDGEALFARMRIKKGTVLGQYTGKIIPAEAVSEGHDKSYSMELPGDKIVDAIETGNFTRYINLSDTRDNVEFQFSPLHNAIVVVAIRDIEPDEQLLVDYNQADPLAGGEYIFLNPEDGWLDSADIYRLNTKSYRLIRNLNLLRPGSLTKGDSFYVSAIGLWVLQNQPVSKAPTHDKHEINLPCMQLDREGRILEKSEADLLTPLMIACYLGQFLQVEWLISKGAHINQQLNYSGFSPILWALKGYQDALGTRRAFICDNSIRIMCALIRHGALVHARSKDEYTFLHHTVTTLPDMAFQKIIKTTMDKKTIGIKRLFNYIDKNNRDILQHCLYFHELDKAIFLLKIYPKYFQDNFQAVSEDQLAYNRTQFQSAFESLDSESKKTFTQELESLGIDLDIYLPGVLDAEPVAGLKI